MGGLGGGVSGLPGKTLISGSSARAGEGTSVAPISAKGGGGIEGGGCKGRGGRSVWVAVAATSKRSLSPSSSGSMSSTLRGCSKSNIATTLCTIKL
ncbi:hypothetical protein Dimus_037986 [Dionaea muscipula]